MRRDEIDKLKCPLCGAADSWSDFGRITFLAVLETRQAQRATTHEDQEIRARSCRECGLICFHDQSILMLGSPRRQYEVEPLHPPT